MSRFWLVQLEDDLTALHTTRTGVWCGVKSVNGVRSVTDLRAITLETLATFLMSDEEFRAGMDLHQKISTQNLIRRYWKRVRQPTLPGVN